MNKKVKRIAKKILIEMGRNEMMKWGFLN